MSHSKLWLPVLLALATYPLTPLSVRADDGFRGWVKDHPQWIDSHRDRYNFFMQHPDEADRHADEWRGMNGNGNGLGHAYGHMKFMDWQRDHQDWVRDHHDRYNWFMQHPDQADRYRNEWEGWHNQDGNSQGNRMAFGDWARDHQDWARDHHDRYNYFMQHPDQADRYRNEWEGWHGHGDKMAFNDWARDHQDWARDHHDRYDYFMHHPDQAEKCRNEWSNWHPSSNNGLHLGEVAHSGMMPGHINPHTNNGLHLGEMKKLMSPGTPHTNNGLHLGEMKKLMPPTTPHTNNGMHLSEFEKLARMKTPSITHAVAHSPAPAAHGMHFTDMVRQIPHMPATHAPAATPHISAAAHMLEMTHMAAPHRGR
jgi:hypothetical protein